MIESYTVWEIMKLDNVSRWTVYRSKKYVKIIVKNYSSKRTKRWYSIRYIRAEDLKKCYSIRA